MVLRDERDDLVAFAAPREAKTRRRHDKQEHEPSRAHRRNCTAGIGPPSASQPRSPRSP
jgi:hypothetical protein